ncbi:MAG: CHAT domain-containing tetratricopeptide repeat protein [Cytophagales bacterium]
MKKLTFTLLLVVHVFIYSQNSKLIRLNTTLKNGDYKKLGKELQKFPTPTLDKDIIRLASIEAVYYSITNDQVSVSKSLDIIEKYISKSNVDYNSDFINAICFTTENLVKIKQIDLSKRLLDSKAFLINTDDESKKLTSLNLINSTIITNAHGGYNVENEELIKKYQKIFKDLEIEKKDKIKKNTYEKYIYARGLFNFKQGNYKEAIKYLNIVKETSKKSTDFELHYSSLYYKVLAKSLTGEDASAIKEAKKSFYFNGNRKNLVKLDIRTFITNYYAHTSKDLNFLRNRSKYNFCVRKLKEDNPLKFKTYLFDYERLLYYNSFEKAYKSQKRDIKNRNINFSTENPWLLDIRTTQYYSNLRNHKFEEARDTLKKYLSLYKNLYGINSPEYSQEKMKYANFLILYSNELDSADNILKNDYDKKITKNYNVLHKNNCDNLITKASYFQETEQYTEQIKLLEKAKSLSEQDSSLENEIKVNEVLAEAYILNGDYAKAELLVNETISKINKQSSKSKKLLGSAAYLDLAKFYINIGKMLEAKKSIAKAKKLAKKAKIDSELILGNSMDEQADLLMEFSKFNKAEALIEDNIEYKKKLFGADNKTLINSYISMAKLNLLEGKYGTCEEYINQATVIALKVYGDKSLKYAKCLDVQRDLQISLGDYKKADMFAQSIFEIRKNKLGGNHILTADAIENKSTTEYLLTDNSSKSIELSDKAAKIYQNKNLNEHPYFANILTNKAFILLNEKKYSEADKLLNQSVSILKNSLGDNSIKLAESYMVLGNLSRENKEYVKAEKYVSEAQKIYKSNFGTEHPSYVKCQSALGKIQYIEGKVDESIQTLLNTTNLYLKFTDTYFKYLNSKEKAKFWTLIKDDFEFLNYIIISTNKTKYFTTVYNNTIKTKGLLLTNSQKIVKIINNTTDTTLKKKYTDWVLKKEELRNLITQGGDGEDYTKTLEKTEAEVNAIEKELSKLSSAFKNLNKIKISEYSTIKNSLKKDEAVVEMIRYRKYTDKFTDSVYYGAVIFDENSKTPKIVTIKNGEKLETKYLSYYRNSLKTRFEDRHSYSKFWQAFDKELVNYKTLYFSPEGVYNMININTFKDTEGNYMLNKYLIINLCNSKDLAENKNNTTHPSEEKKTALVLAGPDFYEGAEGSSIAKLDGAEKEGKLVSEILKKDGYKVDYYTGLDANKEVLKKANSPELVHIATHGSFQQNSDQENFSGDIVRNDFVQDPLFKSNLLFARAGDYIENKKAFMNSPLLSAHEVMDLSLEGTQTVVLSACETGLGTYTVGEGVFGLKRAFLVAGAQSIFTSLFKVADVVTLELMDKYYNYFATQNYSKEKAFYEAQKDILKKYPDPLYWGSFILTGN